MDFSFSERDKTILFYVALSLILLLSLLPRFIIFLNIRFFPPTTDAVYHSLLTKMVLGQKTPFINWEGGQAVAYPLAFATLSALISAIFSIPNFRGVWVLAILLLSLQVIAAYLLGKEMGGKCMGLACAFFFGMGLVPWTPFLYGGMYANMMGQTVMLFLLFFIAKTRLQNRRHVFLAGVMLALLIMSHVISLASFLLAFLAYNVFLILRKEGMKGESIVGFLLLGIILAMPWIIHILPSLAFKVPKPIETVVGPTEGLAMIYFRYGLLPLFSILALYPIVKERNAGIVFLLWCVFLFATGYFFWGNRFNMELYIPLTFLAAYGFAFISSVTLNLLKRRNIVSVLLLSLLVYFLIYTVDNLFYQPTRFATFEVDEYNLEALDWIKDNTKSDALFYASTVSSYIGYINVFADRKVINYPIQSSAEQSLNLFLTEEQERELGDIEKPTNFGGDHFHATLLKLNVDYIYVFHKGGTTEWRNITTGESTYIVKDQLLSQRPDLYEVVYENKYVKIYKIKRKKN